MGQVPRHLFVPQINARAAYIDQPVMAKRAKDGSPISTASQPTIVATMLEQLQVAPGHRVLEVGTGTGYNAALLGALCGPSGVVVTIELEPDLAERAAQVLARLGLDQVQVVVGDGRDGYPPQEPYDRIIVHGGRTRNCTTVVEAVARWRTTGCTPRRSQQSRIDRHVRRNWGRVEKVCRVTLSIRPDQRHCAVVVPRTARARYRPAGPVMYGAGLAVMRMVLLPEKLRCFRLIG